ncbi:YqzG/YhdC family protein [Paenibacillus sp. sptzw28]|uniref:DUF3889 domain-containing protein n=1 Tax=Paenibacillus sp. sptzw28 TaxID=715179 RepID=UPI001C6E3463|nr:DUF3889 domain-containing protein [Paenibacillus sp. sptzw28]QYR19695.1 YqzG/YhdC family protein [Paenibacillus sp. sptzw28]
MNQKFWVVIIVLILTVGQSARVSAEPDYAKWGRVAVKETMKRFHADIVDYKHIGRRTEQTGVLSESFRLILKKGTRQFGVMVRISFDRDTERIIRIQFVEDDKADKAPTFYKII